MENERFLSDEEMLQEETQTEEPEQLPVEEEAAVDTGVTVEEEEPLEALASPPETEAKPYHERYYLKYHEGKRGEPMDLDGTRRLLQRIGFDGGELRQARERQNCAEDLHDSEGKTTHRRACCYCGMGISGVEYFRLPDGRLRCNTCNNTVVESKAEVEALCRSVIANMDSFFGARIDVPISIEVTEERKLKKKLGLPLETEDAQSVLILGTAIHKKQTYRILLENGAPRISLIATFAHELTHIWQYVFWDANVDLRKCAQSKRVLLYEGMAKWAEIQYLYLVGETTVARREEFVTRNRQDEYGEGFRLYEKRYPLSREAMNCGESPFTPNKYPFGE